LVYKLIEKLFMNPGNRQMLYTFYGEQKRIFIKKIKIQFFKVPCVKNLEATSPDVLDIPTMYLQGENESKFNDICYKSTMPLYAISRARV